MPLYLDLTLDRRNLGKFRTLLKANRTIAFLSLSLVNDVKGNAKG